MPKRTDLKKIMIIGSGPIVIGQACEFDYSGTQACKALREEGYQVVLVNSNPATIMTDMEFSDRTYIEPVTAEMAEKIIAQERPDALLPTMGGQTGLNVSVELAEKGVLKRYGVEMIGAKLPAIRMAEDRQLFKDAMIRIGLDVPRSANVRTTEEAVALSRKLGFPLVLRPAFTLGGAGSGIAYDLGELRTKIGHGLAISPVHQVLVEESVIGWKEYELEVMRDLKDNVVIICSIENLDPMGIHTGDSITVAPAQTLTDKEYQVMRDAAIRVIREIGVETGGSNIQFAVHPGTGRMIVIEMNPRVSRSSALASKATGFPIAKFAAKLAVGYTLDEIRNDITRTTPASFEPTIDYVVTKVPRFTFEKFPDADATLNTQMKSVGEVMAIGRTFRESLQKALRSLETGYPGLGAHAKSDPGKHGRDGLLKRLAVPHDGRLFTIRAAFQAGIPLSRIRQATGIDPWFLSHLEILVRDEAVLKRKLRRGLRLTRDELIRAKQDGFSDRQIAFLAGTDEAAVRRWRETLKVRPVFKMVDTCGAEFESATPYLYSTYETEDEAPATKRRKIMILGGGPNRIGQGIEFDYCCVHAAFALKEDGFEVIMVNCNPETVSTDYDTSDRLYFEPLTLEDVLAIVHKERPEGIIVQFGGQTPLKLALPLKKAGARIAGTTPESIDIAEDRKRFDKMLTRLRARRPQNGTARSFAEAEKVARRIGYPVLVRPSYVLGGRAMEIVYDEGSLREFVRQAIDVSPDHPVLIDEFLEDAIEVDVDCVADRTGSAVIAGIMEHIEEAGIHSGDSACVLPPYTLRGDILSEIRRLTLALARELKVVGLMNVQYAIRNDQVFVLEVNPRASRTVPFVSKATGIPWAKVAARVMGGKTLRALGIRPRPFPRHFSIKESVFPFIKFPGSDIVLGPEMRSTGEVMGIDRVFGNAFAKSQISAGQSFPLKGNVFLSVKNKDKRSIIFIAKKISDLGFRLLATRGTAEMLRNNGLEVTEARKVAEGRPNVTDQIRGGEVDLIINTPAGKGPRSDDFEIRRAAVLRQVPVITTISGASAVVNAIETMRREPLSVMALQDYFKEVKS